MKRISLRKVNGLLFLNDHQRGFIFNPTVPVEGTLSESATPGKLSQVGPVKAREGRHYDSHRFLSTTPPYTHRGQCQGSVPSAKSHPITVQLSVNEVQWILRISITSDYRRRYYRSRTHSYCSIVVVLEETNGGKFINKGVCFVFAGSTGSVYFWGSSRCWDRRQSNNFILHLS